MWWTTAAWVAWCWSGTGGVQGQDDDVVDDRSQDDLVDDGLIRRVAGGSAARAWVALCRDLKQPKAYGNLAVNRTCEIAR